MQTHQGWGRVQEWGAGAQDIMGHDSWKDPYGMGGGSFETPLPLPPLQQPTAPKLLPSEWLWKMFVRK